jgi:hypothetical protein
MTTLADKVNLPLAAIDNIGQELRADYMVALIYELQQGRPFPAALTTNQTANLVAAAPAMMPIKQETSPARQASS